MDLQKLSKVYHYMEEHTESKKKKDIYDIGVCHHKLKTEKRERVATWLKRGATLELLRENQLKTHVTGRKGGAYILKPKAIQNKSLIDQIKYRHRTL